MAGRIFAVGDIHGCSIALATLIEAIDPKPEDTVVVLGDVVDWGPDVSGCIPQLMALAERCQFLMVRGNHEEMLFNAIEAPSELRYWLQFGGDATLKSYGYTGGPPSIDAEHVKFLKSQSRDYHETNDFIFVHANYYPNMPMPEQPDLMLRWEFVDRQEARPHYSGKTIFAGHTPQTNGVPLDLGFLKVIDTDCSRGGWLTALEAQTGEYIQANQSGVLKRASLPHQRPPLASS